MQEKFESLIEGVNDWTTKGLQIYKLDKVHSTHNLQHRMTRHELYKMSLILLAFISKSNVVILIMLMFWAIATVESHFMRTRLDQLYHEHNQ